MERAESEALLAATRRAIEETDADQRLTADHIRFLHGAWLGKIYPWAGQYRNVNISKGGFPFAAASQIPRLMEKLDGNGRWARLVATLMALQAGLPPLDFSGVKGRERRRYFDAVHAAMAGNLAPMIQVFEHVIARTLRKRRS